MSYFAKPRISQDGYDIKAGGAPDEIWRVQIPQGGRRHVALCCAKGQIVRSNNPNVVQAGDISETGSRNADVRMLTVYGRNPGFTVLDCVLPGSNSPWGSVQVQVLANMSKGVSPSDTVYEFDDGNVAVDPRKHSKYIDTLCQAVGYGIYNGGFFVYVPQSISPYPFLVPENMLWFGATKPEFVTDMIFNSQAEAIRAVGGTAQPHRVAYFWGKLVFPTAFTGATTPTIVNTASFVVDELVKEVQNELTVMAITMAIPIVGGMIGGAIALGMSGRGIPARIMKARNAGPGAPRRIPQRPAIPPTRWVPKTGPIQVFRPLNPGESYLNYGKAMHKDGLPRYFELRYPNAKVKLNTREGVTGPDVEVQFTDGQAPVNFKFGELKTIRTPVSSIQQQAEFNWGYEIGDGRLFFYDRQGYMMEGVVDRPPY